MGAASLAQAQAFKATTGTLPAHTPQAQARRAVAAARQGAKERKWREAVGTTGTEPSTEWYVDKVTPKLAA